LSITDELTGLFNKRWFSSKLLSEIEHNTRVGEAVSLIIMDVDHFKRLNDTYGHSTGDMVLARLGQLINENIREHDIPCRYGGEEFAVILTATGLEKAYQAGERLRNAFEAMTISLDDGSRIQATISVGVGQLSEDEHEKSFFDRVDRAMYRAKDSGRNRVLRAA
jgi:diguanylate cyclase (GGDEF)-like protein